MPSRPSRPGRAALIAAGPALTGSALCIGVGIAYGKTWLALPAAAGLLIAAAALGAFWHPPDDVMAVADATREPPRLPKQWTQRDWAEVEALLARANQHRPGKD